MSEDKNNIGPEDADRLERILSHMRLYHVQSLKLGDVAITLSPLTPDGKVPVDPFEGLDPLLREALGGK